MARAAFPRRRRLLGADEYRRVFAYRWRVAGRFVAVASAPNGRDEARLGLAVGKRYCRRAVDRNRIKRVVRDWFRVRAERLAGLDLVCSVRSGAAGAANASLRADLEHLERRLVAGADATISIQQGD